MTPDPAAMPGRRDWGAAALVGAIFILVVASIAAFALEREKQLLITQARQDASTLAALFEENTARTFDGVANALEGVAIYMAAVQPPRNDEAARESMRARLPFNPTVRAFFVIAPDGYIAHDTDYPNTPNVSLADRPYFRRYLQDPGLTRAVSEAMQSRSGLGWFVASTRRIVSRDGRFLGVAVAAVQLDSISRLYRKLDMQPGQQISLLQANGTLLARFPADDSLVGHSFAQFPVFAERMKQERAGTFVTSGPPWDYERIVSYRALESQPLTVIVLSRMSNVLEGWHRTVAATVVALLVLTVITAGAAWFFVERQRERVRAQVQESAKEAALDVDRRRSEFLATLSHELRNVLTPVQNCVQILKISRPGSEQALRAIEVQSQQLAQMRRLIDDLLDVARINSGKVHLELRGLDLRTVLHLAADAVHPAMERARHTFEMSLPAEELPMSGDETRLQQVFTNLLANAAKYTPVGGHVHLRARREGHEAVVEIADDGLGIPEESQAKIFEMFEQVASHSGQRQGGLGIGLGLVSRLVALHGGQVTVASEGAGRGSTFTVRLPLAVGQAG